MAPSARQIGSCSWERQKLEAEPTVYGEELTGDEVGASGEEDCGGGDVLGGPVALHGGLLGKVLVVGTYFALDDHAGGDAVDANLWRPSLGHGLGEHVEGSFGGAVVGMGGPGVTATE